MIEPAGAHIREAGPRTFAACLAALLELRAQDVPAPDDGSHDAQWQEWLAARGLALLPLPVRDWPGYAIGLVDGRDALDAVVLFGGVVTYDPRGRQRPPVADEALVLVPLDPVWEPDDGAVGAGSVEGIYLGPASAALPLVASRARAIAGRGLIGDRYAHGSGTFAGGPTRAGQALTLIEAEALEEVGLISAAESRRNVVTRGIRLNALVGRRFAVGDALCLGRRLCEPCAHLARLTRPDVIRPYVHRSGLRADVLAGGSIRVGDPVRPL